MASQLRCQGIQSRGPGHITPSFHSSTVLLETNVVLYSGSSTPKYIQRRNAPEELPTAGTKNEKEWTERTRSNTEECLLPTVLHDLSDHVFFHLYQISLWE